MSRSKIWFPHCPKKYKKQSNYLKLFHNIMNNSEAGSTYHYWQKPHLTLFLWYSSCYCTWVSTPLKLKFSFAILVPWELYTKCQGHMDCHEEQMLCFCIKLFIVWTKEMPCCLLNGEMQSHLMIRLLGKFNKLLNISNFCWVMTILLLWALVTRCSFASIVK
jgi:hypothetical protein